MVQLLAFLLLGLGIDDAFVITQNYRQTPDALGGRGKVATALRISGTSISVTSFTDMVKLRDRLFVCLFVCLFVILMN